MKDKGIKLSNDIWTKPKVKKMQLLKGIANIVKDSSTLNWTSVPADAIDVIESIRTGDNTGKIGWILISRSLADALLNLIVENYDTIEKSDIVTEDLDAEINSLLESKEFFINVDFFKHPDKFLLLSNLNPILTAYLKLFNFNKNIIENILVRFPNYFVFSLNDEWRRNYIYYQQITDNLNTPFYEATKKENEWFNYSNWLNKQIDKPIFNESFSLKQIYIPLRAFYKVKDKTIIPICTKIFRNFEYDRIVIDLESEIHQWLTKSDKNDSIRIIRGGPGYGKSSFFKILAARLSREGKRVLYIPLHLFDIIDDFTNAVQSFIRIDGLLNIDPFEEEKLIILFDGLDELSMQGSILADVANKFIREVEKNVTRYNNVKTKLQIIISGRDVVIQQNESEFRGEKQILRLLPFYLTDKGKESFKDTKNLLIEDQRNLWWEKYGQVKGKKYKNLPKSLNNEDLDEITAHPLLNYLVALSYERGKIKFTDDTNLNELYFDLLEAVFVRSYSESKTLKVVCKLEFPEFTRMLEEIATSSWHGDSRTTTVKDIENHFINSGLQKHLNNFIKDAEKGVISLLATFYFRQAGQTTLGNKTFEFTHKSFGEYLIARRIVNIIFLINKRFRENVNYFDDGWNINKCLVEWTKLFRHKEIDLDLIKFIKNEFSLKYNESKDILFKIQETIIMLINHFLRTGIPMENLNPRLSFIVENKQAINSEKALLIILSLISHQTNRISNIEWPTKTAFGNWLGRICQQRVGPSQYILQFLNNLNIDHAIIPLKDLYSANLHKSSLKQSDLQVAILRNVNLNSASLKNAQLSGADLRGANLRNADLRGANLRNADLQDADLQDADLRGANLRNTDLTKVRLDGAKLIDVILTEANLHRAILQNADLTKARLDGAKLEFAILTKANIQNADLTKANLDGAKLNDVNLKKANLIGANLRNADLRNADLRNADLRNADLRNADLRNAVLTGAKLEFAKLED